MSSYKDLFKNCEKLQSKKISDKRDACSDLQHQLTIEEIINSLNKSKNHAWEEIFYAVKKAMWQENASLQSAYTSGKKLSSPNILHFQNLHELVLLVIKTANEKVAHLKFKELNSYLELCLTNPMIIKHCNNRFVYALSNYILCNEEYWSKAEKADYLKLLDVLKKMHIKNADSRVLESIAFAFQYGPKHKMSVSTIVEQLDFVVNCCENIHNYITVVQQNAIQLSLIFCKQISVDKRTICCIFGERALPNLLSNMKYIRDKSLLLLMELLLLQVKIHHPTGVTKDNRLSYAPSWPIWNKILNSIWSFLIKLMIDKNKDIFLVKAESFQTHILFTELAVEVYNQIANGKNENLTRNSDDKELQVKKPKFFEISLTTPYDSEHDFMDDRCWLNLIPEILKSYPGVINEAIYEKIFKYFENELRKELTSCKRGDIYRCLAVLIDIEESIEITNFLTFDVWSRMWDAVHRSIGLNQTILDTHQLACKLIARKKSNLVDELFKTYASHVICINETSLNTLNILGQNVQISDQISDKPRINLIKWILEKEVNDHFAYKITATNLMHIVLRQWPAATTSKLENSRTIQDFEEVYKFNNMEGGLFAIDRDKTVKQTSAWQYVLHNEAFTSLVDRLQEIITMAEDKKHLKIFLHVAVLCVNLISLMKCYNIQLGIETITNMVRSFTPLLSELFLNYLSNTKETENLDIMLQILDIDNGSNHVVKEAIPMHVIGSIFQHLSEMSETGDSEEDDDIDIINTKMEITFGIVRFLCKYAMHGSNQTQTLALEALLAYEMEEYSSLHYKAVLIILNNLREYEGLLTHQHLESTYKMIRTLCITRHKEHDVALNVLYVLCDLFPHVAAHSQEDSCGNFVDLLKPFYEYSNNFGPQILVVIANCIGKLLEIFSDFRYTKWSENSYAILELPDMLLHDSQLVRIAAIRNLTNAFMLKSTKYVQMKMLFVKISNVCDEVLNENVPPQTDEFTNRASCILYMFANIIVANSNLRCKALFELLKHIYVHQLDLDMAKEVLLEITRKLELNNSSVLLETSLDYLLRQWKLQKYSLDNLPYALFGFNSLADFCNKYTSHLISFLISEEDLSMFLKISESIEKSPEEMVEISYPKTVAKKLILQSFTSTALENNITVEDITSKRIMQDHLKTHLSEQKMHDLIVEKLDVIVVCISDFVYDEPSLVNIHGEDYSMVKPETIFISENVFNDTLKILEENLGENCSLINYLITNRVDQLQNIIMLLHEKLHKSISVEDKLLSLHRYFIFIKLLFPYFKQQHKINTFLIREITFTFNNLIRTKKHHLLKTTTAKYLSKLINWVLPECAHIFKDFLIFTVSTILSVEAPDKNFTEISAKILDKLVIKHAACLKDVLKILDPLPDTVAFTKHREVHFKIKYGTSRPKLSTEIEHFLKAGEYMRCYGERTEGLRYLHKELIERKDELKDMYSALFDMKGSLSKGSLLHNLVVALVKLTSSSIINEKIEAARCLGELGVSNLTTTALRREDDIDKFKGLPQEIWTKMIVTLLSDYIVDDDINIVIPATKALYSILKSQEGTRLIANQNEDDLINITYLHPFISRKKNAQTKMQIIEKNFKSVFDNRNIWCPENEITHIEWIVQLVCNILDCFKQDSYFKLLIPIVKIKVSFAEQLLPLLVNILVDAHSSFNESLSNSIEAFFAKHWEIHYSGSQNDKLVQLQLPSVQCMLNIVHFVRLQRNVSCSGNAKVTELQLNYLHVALAAHFCSAYFSAIMYVELWGRNFLNGCKEKANYVNDQKTALEIILKCSDKALFAQNILMKAYKSVGDKDALHNGYLENPFNSNDTNTFNDSKHWSLLASSSSNEQSQSSINQTNSLFKSQNLLEEAQLHCISELTKWNLPVQANDTFESHRCLGLKALYEKDECTFEQSIKNARNLITASLQNTSLESCKNLYEPLTKLQCLVELEEFYSSMENQLFNQWQIKDSINQNEMIYLQDILMHRITMMNIRLQQGNESVKNYLVTLHINLAELARSKGNISIAKQSISQLENLTNLDENLKGKIMLETAKIFWQIDKETAERLLRDLVHNDRGHNFKLKAESLKLYGTWMAEKNVENSDDIISKYFLKSIDVLTEGTILKNEEFYEVYNIIGRFSDEKYQEVQQYVKSSNFSSKKERMEKIKETAEKLKSAPNATDNDVRRAVFMFQQQTKLDEDEVESVLKRMDNYLQLAFKHYILNLLYSNKNNTLIFRIFSLWLEKREDAAIKELVNKYIMKVPTFKILPIIPQMIPHLNAKSQDTFINHVFNIIKKCAIEHPHHVIPLIWSVANSNKDDVYNKTKANRESNEARVQGAQKLLETLKSESKLKNIIKQIEQTSDALIELAYYEVKNKDAPKLTIPAKFKIRDIHNFNEAMLPTYNLPIRENGNYDNVVGIHKYSNEFALVGGINAPKRIQCIGTDGKTYNQLVKGQDDLRQDAVMQQVFTIMNHLLAINKSTLNLHIRTYKVLPLSKRSGVLEWVDHSIPLGDYLTGPKGAHEIYNKKDYSTIKCRDIFRNMAKESDNTKLRKYNQICKNLKPVFHKFFESTFLQPTIWYERRKAYTHSIATTSMCGYILGLGDRHPQNILLDKETAEVIHIDFGIAFEQGRLLPTPETVPFRLSRDIEDGMGLTGVEGTFRSSCEKTMMVLRNNTTTILTILEVLLYDPLYAWTITPQEAYSRQRSHRNEAGSSDTIDNAAQGNTQTNLMAERALNRLRLKLNGTENSSTSIEGQVGTLIQQARDPANLCKLFHGWQPYL